VRFAWMVCGVEARKDGRDDNENGLEVDRSRL
jgi:hypothetical protein